MNGAHLHLIVNHLPVVSVLFAVGFLLFGILRKSRGLIRVGMVISVIVGLTGTAAFLTGEGAEDVLEQWPDADRQLIHKHEETAETAFQAAVILGFIGLAGLVFSGRHAGVNKIAPVLALVLALLTSIIMALAANEGGDIRHPEIRDGAVPPTGQSLTPGGEVDDDH
jgi:uncharacterized membrane protein